MAVQLGGQTIPRMGRVQRTPAHNWQVRARPFVIQPIVLAPVLPGETLKNLLFQSRAVSQPLKNPLVGWWLEYYFFYVKLRDMDERDHFTQMMLDPEYSMAPVTGSHTAAVLDHYYATGAGINWVKLCLKRITEEFFRNEGEAWDAFLIDGMPIASINGESWQNTLYQNSEYVADDVDLAVGGDALITASEIHKTMMLWEQLRMMQMTEMSFEDYLKTYGVRVETEQPHIPELIRYVRDWTYPTNTVDPATGTPSSAVSWAISERADKDRFFREPGFIFGVTVTRPKVYLRGQTGFAAKHLNDAFDWLPAIMRDDPATSLRQITTAGSVLPGTQDASYWQDVRDLFMYGDQFVNYAVADTASNFVDLPGPTLQRRYVDEADVTELFTGATPAAEIRQDGVCRLSISGALQDATPRSNPGGGASFA